MGYNFLSTDLLRTDMVMGHAWKYLKKKEGEIYDPMGIFDYRS